MSGLKRRLDDLSRCAKARKAKLPTALATHSSCGSFDDGGVHRRSVGVLALEVPIWELEGLALQVAYADRGAARRALPEAAGWKLY